ncbi:hypothetical protein N7650_22070 [Pseudomonas sp. GD04058]|uniref:hypothetical protein n=1 Tax=Pseudomonas sp. GD04058 TaxID=2975429 RepID=UPI002447D70F|nr:hypothetical protein [Pseudomonas sp. GD04058]MDG9885532.1 hypothetical protein [Pseudomonas sp. GD04058]
MKVSIYAARTLGRALLATALATVLTACAQAPAQNAPRAQVTVEPLGWSEAQWEQDSRFHCPTDQFLIARRHRGDEYQKGWTAYQCGKAFQFQAIPIKDPKLIREVHEAAGIEFICPENQVMTGREHDGDENGATRYYCGTPYDYWDRPLQVKPDKWFWTPDENIEHTAACPENMFMIGRYHKGDEEEPSRYLCARVF